MEGFDEHVVFCLLLTACLLPLWTSAYFLTGDGPCHLHNAGYCSTGYAINTGRSTTVLLVEPEF